MHRLECVEDGASKFWEGSVKGSVLTVRFGKIGTDGQSKDKDLGSADAAQKELEKLVREKTKKGYAPAGASQVATMGAEPETRDEPSVEPAAKPSARPPKSKAGPGRDKAADAGTVLKVAHDAQAALTAPSAEALVRLVARELGAATPPTWIHFEHGESSIIARTVAPTLVAEVVDAGVFYDDHRAAGRVVLQRSSVIVLADDPADDVKHPLDLAALPTVYGFDPDATVVLANLRWLGAAPSAADAVAIWSTAFAAVSGELPAWEEPSTPAPRAKPAKSAAPTDTPAPPAVHAVFLGGFSRDSRYDAVGGCWATAPAKIMAERSDARGGELGGDPIVCDGTVYGARYASSVTVAAFDTRSLTERWVSPLAVTNCWPVRGGFVEGDTLVMALKDRLIGLATADGSERFSAKLATVNAEPVRTPSGYVVSTKKELVGLDGVTRKKRWAAPLPSEHGTSGGLAFGGGIVVASADVLCAFDDATGAVRWRGTAKHGHGPTIVGDAVYFFVHGMLRALSLATGEPLWNEAGVGPDDQAYFGGRLAVGAGVGVLRTYGGSIRAVDLATGATRWSHACPGAATTSNPLTIVGDCLLALHHEGGEKSVVALELSTGAQRWRTAPLRSETAGTPQGYAPIVPVHGAAGALEALLVPGTDGLFVLRA